jgi:hypothetical protein
VRTSADVGSIATADYAAAKLADLLSLPGGPTPKPVTPPAPVAPTPKQPDKPAKPDPLEPIKPDPKPQPANPVDPQPVNPAPAPDRLGWLAAAILGVLLLILRRK